MILFIALLSMHMHHVPSFFSTSKDGIAHGLRLGLINCLLEVLRLSLEVLDALGGSFDNKEDSASFLLEPG